LFGGSNSLISSELEQKILNKELEVKDRISMVLARSGLLNRLVSSDVALGSSIKIVLENIPYQLVNDLVSEFKAVACNIFNHQKGICLILQLDMSKRWEDL
jgi:hypothetical protein